MLIFNDDINSGFKQSRCSQQTVLQPTISKRKHSTEIKFTKRAKNKLTKPNKDFLKALGLTVN